MVPQPITIRASVCSASATQDREWPGLPNTYYLYSVPAYLMRAVGEFCRILSIVEAEPGLDASRSRIAGVVRPTAYAFLIPMYGARGVAFATLTCFLVVVIAITFIMPISSFGWSVDLILLFPALLWILNISTPAEHRSVFHLLFREPATPQ
jgi:hypothetical protein